MMITGFGWGYRGRASEPQRLGATEEGLKALVNVRYYPVSNQACFADSPARCAGPTRR
jgi:hypothetical protein